MQNRLKTFFTLLFLSLILCNCGKPDEVKAPIIPTTFAHFAIRYLEGSKDLRGQASFSQGDSIAIAKPIKIEGGVSFMSSGMKQKDLPRQIIRYDATLKSDFEAPFRFGFKLEGDETPREISYSMSPVGDFDVRSADKEEGLRIGLKTPVSNTEALLLMFTDANQEVRTILRPGPFSKDVLFIPADALLHFIPGAYQLYIVKSKEEKRIENGVDTQVHIEFYSEEVTFVLK